jgi:hypothetical protein
MGGGSMKLPNVVLLALLALVTCTGCVVGDYVPRPVVVESPPPPPVVVVPAQVYVAPPVVVVEPYYYSPYYCYGCWHGWYRGRYGYHRWR